MDSSARTKGPVFRLVAGLAATIVIDLITVGALPFMGLPADGGFSVIGDTAAGFFSLFGVEVVGGVPYFQPFAGSVPGGCNSAS